MYSTDPPWDHDGRYFRDALLGANYCVPILWLSLFDANGLVTWPGIHDGSPYAAVIQPTTECVKRSRTRLEDWSRRWPHVFGEISGLWLDYIGAVQDAYLAVWTEEMTWGAGAESWAADLRGYLSGLDDPQSADFRSALNQSSIRTSGDRLEPSDTVGLVTAGYTWARQAPWEGAAHGPYWQGPEPGDDHSGCRMCVRASPDRKTDGPQARLAGFMNQNVRLLAQTWRLLVELGAESRFDGVTLRALYQVDPDGFRDAWREETGADPPRWLIEDDGL